MKRIISLLLSVLLVTAIFTAVPLTASAATPDSAEVAVPAMPNGTFGNCTWEFNITTGKLTISGSGATGDYNLLSEKPWETYKDEITEVIVMNGVTEIGQALFAETKNLTKVSLAPSVATIKRERFTVVTI